MAEYQGDGQGEKSLAHVVEMPCGAPKAAAQDLAVAGLDVLGLNEPEKLAVGPSLEGVFLQVGAARDTPAEQEQRGRADEPEIRPCAREAGVRIGGHAPQGQDEQPPVDDEPSPEHLEAQVLVDQVIGVELNPLEDEVVENVECEESRVQEDAGIGVFAETFVVPRGSGQGIDRKHRAADDVEVHLDVEAVAEER